jgi:hypothetical protein
MTAALDLTRTEPDRRRLLLLRAELYVLAGERAEAVADYRTVLASSPNDPGAQAGLERLGQAP